MKVLLIFLLLTTLVHSQQSESYFIKKDGKKVIVSSGKNGKDIKEDGYLDSKNYELTSPFFYYFNSDQKKKKINQNKIEEAFLDGRHFTHLKIGGFSGLARLQEIIVENENHVLTQYYFDRMFVYLFDKNKEEFIIKKYPISKKKEKYKKLVENEILPYFKSCPDFVNQIKKELLHDYENYNKHDNFLFYNVTNIDCNK